MPNQNVCFLVEKLTDGTMSELSKKIKN